MCSKVLNGHIILTDTSITTILAPEMTYTPKNTYPDNRAEAPPGTATGRRKRHPFSWDIQLSGFDTQESGRVRRTRNRPGAIRPGGTRISGGQRLRDPEPRTAKIEDHAEAFEETDAQKSVPRKPHTVFKQQHRLAAKSIGIHKDHLGRPDHRQPFAGGGSSFQFLNARAGNEFLHFGLVSKERQQHGIAQIHDQFRRFSDTPAAVVDKRQ